MVIEECICRYLKLIIAVKDVDVHSPSIPGQKGRAFGNSTPLDRLRLRETFLSLGNSSTPIQTHHSHGEAWVCLPVIGLFSYPQPSTILETIQSNPVHL